MTNSQAASHESWLVRYSPALQDLVEAIPIISDNGLPILTENNFHSPSFIWTPRLLIFRLSVGPPHFLFMKTPRAPPPRTPLFGTGDYIKMSRNKENLYARLSLCLILEVL